MKFPEIVLVTSTVFLLSLETVMTELMFTPVTLLPHLMSESIGVSNPETLSVIGPSASKSSTSLENKLSSSSVSLLNAELMAVVLKYSSSLRYEGSVMLSFWQPLMRIVRRNRKGTRDLRNLLWVAKDFAVYIVVCFYIFVLSVSFRHRTKPINL